MQSTTQAAQYQQTIKNLNNRYWRLNNLYFIKNEKGQKVLFRFNWAQEVFYKSIWYFNCVLKARQLGFSTFIAIYALDACLWNDNFRCGIIDATLPDAMRKLDKARFAYDNLPEQLKERITKVKDGAQEIEFSNGSGIVCGTSHRGDTLQLLHVSEYGKISARTPEKSKEIKSGAFNAVHAGQQIFVESTAEGQSGDFFDLVQAARALENSGTRLSALDPKFHFFPWYRNPDYTLGQADIETTVITDKQKQYFAGLAYELTPGQKAWYAKKEALMGDLMRREYPSTPDEAFEASMEGAYFVKQMTQARQAGNMKRIPWEPSRQVHTFWDIADNSDYMAVWFFQHIGHEYRFIRYIQAAGEDYGWFQNKLVSFGYVYGKHYWPHDGGNKTQTPRGLMTKKEIANTFGIAPIHIVGRTRDKLASIQRARTVIPRCLFCTENAAEGIKLLESYRKEWNDKLGMWSERPLHDEASHCADAFMTFVDGYQERNVEFIDREHYQSKAETYDPFDY